MGRGGKLGKAYMILNACYWTQHLINTDGCSAGGVVVKSFVGSRANPLLWAREYALWIKLIGNFPSECHSLTCQGLIQCSD